MGPATDGKARPIWLALSWADIAPPFWSTIARKSTEQIYSCIFEDKFQWTDIFISAKFGNSQTKILNNSSWTSNIYGTAYGRFFTWNPQRRISPDKKDLIYMLANRSFKFFIHVHDINFFLLNVSPLGPPKAFYEFDGNTMRNHYNELVLTKHTKLNLDHQPCERESYSKSGM